MWRLKGYIGNFWDNKQDTQNIHAFSICEIVEPMLIIVHNGIFHLRAFFKFILAWFI